METITILKNQIDVTFRVNKSIKRSAVYFLLDEGKSVREALELIKDKMPNIFMTKKELKEAFLVKLN